MNRALIFLTKATSILLVILSPINCNPSPKFISSFSKQKSILTSFQFINSIAIASSLLTIQNKKLEMLSSSNSNANAPSWSEKVYLITGSTDGIGKHTAKRLASLGCTVCLHGRNDNKLEMTKTEILNEFPSAKLKTYCSDVSTIRNTKLLADNILRDNIRLDGLVNNAGIFTNKYVITEDNLESTFAVNVMAPFILCLLLLPLLKSTPNSRVINVSSTSQEEGDPRINLSDLQFEHGGFSDHASYSLSKLCMVTMSHELALRVSPSDSLIICCDPGDVDTVMLRTGWAGYQGMKIEDANDEYELTTRPFDSSVHGTYFVGLRETKCNPQVYQDNLRLGLWNFLEQKSGLTLPTK